MKKAVLYIIFILLISSCGVERVYTPANYGAIKKYIAKPVYNNKDTTANYISLAVSNGKHPIREGTNDTKLIGSLNYHHSKSFKKYNFYYGLGLNYGSYKFKNALIDVIVANETQSFYSINPKIGFSFKSTRPNIDYEIIGLELNYNYENGNYQNKLNEIEPSSAIRVINEKSLFSLNIFSEILFKIDENNTIGLGLFSGGLLGLDEKKYNIEEGGGGHFSGLTFSYRFKKYIFAVVTEKGALNIKSVNYSMTYQF